MTMWVFRSNRHNYAYPSAKIRVWFDKDDARAHLKQLCGGARQIRDLGDRLEVDLPGYGCVPAATVGMARVDVPDIGL